MARKNHPNHPIDQKKRSYSGSTKGKKINLHDKQLPSTTTKDETSGSLNKDVIPEEIDTHFQIYGKHAWEVEYGDKCEICGRRIDEFGFCACGSQGE
jgi:hypothetical protein